MKEEFMENNQHSENETEILAGWKKIETEYVPHGLTPAERAQLEMAIAIERVAKITPFVLA